MSMQPSKEGDGVCPPLGETHISEIEHNPSCESPENQFEFQHTLPKESDGEKDYVEDVKSTKNEIDAYRSGEDFD